MDSCIIDVEVVGLRQYNRRSTLFHGGISTREEPWIVYATHRRRSVVSVAIRGCVVASVSRVIGV